MTDKYAKDASHSVPDTAGSSHPRPGVAPGCVAGRRDQGRCSGGAAPAAQECSKKESAPAPAAPQEAASAPSGAHLGRLEQLKPPDDMRGRPKLLAYLDRLTGKALHPTAGDAGGSVDSLLQ